MSLWCQCLDQKQTKQKVFEDFCLASKMWLNQKLFSFDSSLGDRLEILKNLIDFLGKTMTLKRHYEINWPLPTTTTPTLTPTSSMVPAIIVPAPATAIPSTTSIVASASIVVTTVVASASGVVASASGVVTAAVASSSRSSMTLFTWNSSRFGS